MLLGSLESLEIGTAGALLALSLGNVEISTDGGRGLQISGRLGWLDLWCLGWRPWRPAGVRVHAIQYRTRRFLGGASRFSRSRFEVPGYRHVFGSAWLRRGAGGWLSVVGDFRFERDSLGGITWILG